MGMIGTFDGFTTARLGIYAAQHGLRVTGNNLSNINTDGYTRQRLDQVSLKSGANDMYRSIYDNHVGNGALVTGFNQIRDPYLDIRYRTTNADVGYTDTMLSGLQEIANTLDEVGKGITTASREEGDGILYAQLRDMRDMLMQLMNDPTKANDTLVRNSAETLCTLFNSYAGSLETLRKHTEKDFSSQVTGVNEILTNIRDLNESIRNSEICGDKALELRDERNRQLDALSEYMHIKVEYVMEDIGAGVQVEKLIVSLGNANPDPTVTSDETVLIDGIYGAKLLYPEEINGEANTHYTLQVGNLVDAKNVLPKNHNEVNAGRPITLEDNDLHGSLQAIRELLTEKGEFATQDDIDLDPNASTKRGIPYYQMSLDLLARKFAETYNKLNQNALTDKDGKIIFETQEAGKTPEELGVRLVEADESGVAGYFIDKNGYYVGIHDVNCDMHKAQINVDDSLAAAMQKIKEAGVTDSNRAAALLNADGTLKNEAQAQQLLDSFVKAHGVTQAGLTNGKFAKGVITSASPEGAGVLFSNRNDGDRTGNPDDPNDPDNPMITAANISVSHSWYTGAVQVVPKFTVLYDGDIKDSTQNVNIDHMISMIEKGLVYNPQELDPKAVSGKLFEGSFNDMFDNMCATLGNDQRVNTVELNTSYTQLVELGTSRDGVSGVDLNDEAMNIMMYQKAYSAACRMMTAIDEAIERLINNTGIAGR